MSKSRLALIFLLLLAFVPVSAQNVTNLSFGFQCGTNTPNCPNYVWPATPAQPNVFRLWDANVQWSVLSQSSGEYFWTPIDSWLDTIAAHQPETVMYTFGRAPQWISSGSCGSNAWAGCAGPPTDLGADGSPTFNSFVTALTTHCNPNNRCVKDYIKHWELWNEPNNQPFWTGTPNQLYAMMAPAVAIIRQNVPNAIVHTPPISGADQTWMGSWLALENSNGRLSDIYNFHIYLLTESPENRLLQVQWMLNLKNRTPNWTATAWWNSETSFQNEGNYTCSTSFTAQDCESQPARWQILQLAQGGANISWYYWYSTIGSNPAYDTIFQSMMSWLAGDTFTGPCSNNGNVWSCPVTESNGNPALIVWNVTGNAQYTPATQYTQMKSFSSGSIANLTSQTVTISYAPVIFETAKVAPPTDLSATVK